MRWGVEHLHYEVTRRLQRMRRVRIGSARNLLIGIWLSIMAGVVITKTLGGRVTFVIGIGLVIALIAYVFARRRRTWHLPKQEFDRLWKRWCAVHGMPKGVIVRRQPLGQSEKREMEPDVSLYSFDRAVICDRARTVDLLLANNFHFENNCAVLSVDGYPRAAFDTVLAMLRRNPRLRIFALHDCTRDGCALARKLATDPKWFLGQRVVDVGLRPVHARNLPNLLAASAAPAIALGISKEELDWLSRYSAEIAALRPEQVLRRLFHAMNKASEHDDDEFDVDSDNRRERGVVDDDESFSVDMGADDGGADSFG